MASNNTFLTPNRNSSVVFHFFENFLLYAKYVVMSEQIYLLRYEILDIQSKPPINIIMVLLFLRIFAVFLANVSIASPK